MGIFFLIKCITTKIPCTRHGVSLVASVVSQLFKFSEKLLNIKWNKSFINKVFFNKYIGYNEKYIHLCTIKTHDWHLWRKFIAGHSSLSNNTYCSSNTAAVVASKGKTSLKID